MRRLRRHRLVAILPTIALLITGVAGPVHASDTTPPPVTTPTPAPAASTPGVSTSPAPAEPPSTTAPPTAVPGTTAPHTPAATQPTEPTAPATPLVTPATPPAAPLPAAPAAPARAAAAPGPNDVMPSGPLKSCVLGNGAADASGKSVMFDENWQPLPPEAVTFALTAKVDRLDCAFPTGGDWTGAEFFSNLTNLTLKNTATDPTAVPVHFPRLVALTLVGPLKEFPSLQGFTSLRTLDLYQTSITAIPTGTLSDTLEELNLSGRQIDSIAGVSFPALKKLHLSGNRLTSFAGANLPSLTYLNVGGSARLTSPVAGLNAPRLVELMADQGSFSSLEGMDLPALTTLSMNQSKVTSLNGLKAPNLTSLNVGSNQLTSLDGLMAPNLTSLDVGHNQLTSFRADLPQLRELSASGNKLTTLSGLNAPRLEQAHLEGNQLTSLEGLTAPTLRALFATNNAFTTFDVLLPFADRADPEMTISGPFTDFTALPKLGQLKVTAYGLPVTSPKTFTAAESAALADLGVNFKVSPDLPGTWGGVGNMAAVNPATGRFTPATNGKFQVNLRFAHRNILARGLIEGTAVGEGKVTVSVKQVVVPPPGGDAVFEVTVDGHPVTGSYLRTFSGTVVEGSQSTSGRITLPKAQGEYQAVAETAGGLFYSETFIVALGPDVPDPAFRRCLEEKAGAPLTTVNLANVRGGLDCSKRGIKSMEGWHLTGAAKIDLSDNEISDLRPLAVASGGLIDLSRNRVSDVSWLAMRDMTWDHIYFGTPTFARRATGVILDENEISDISPLKDATLWPQGDSAVAISMKSQRVGVAPAKTGAPATLPKALGRGGETVPLAVPTGTVTGDTVSFATAGTHALSWTHKNPNDARGPVEFDGQFLVPVDVSPGIQLDPPALTAGYTIRVTAEGFAPNEPITVTLSTGATLNGTADAAGRRTFRVELPLEIRELRIEAKSADGARTAQRTVSVAADVQLSFPDEALAACLREHAKIPADQPIHRSQVLTITRLNCEGRGISDLTGLDHLRASDILLGRNAVTSLDTLPTLTMGPRAVGRPETTLDLSRNQIGDLGTVRPQPSVEFIDLGSNRIHDFSAIQRNMNRTYLDGQVVPLAPTVVGGSVTLPVLKSPAESEATPSKTRLKLPDGVTVSDGVATFPAAGDYLIEWTIIREVDGWVWDETGGVFTITVVEPGERRVLVNPTSLYAGQMVNVVATGMTPGEEVTFLLHSQPVVLGKARADGLGVASLSEIVIPLDTAPGEHHIVANGRSGAPMTTALTILEVPTDPDIVVPGTPQDGSGSRPAIDRASLPQLSDDASAAAGVTDSQSFARAQLAHTGTGASALAMLAGLLIAAGAATILVSRRKQA